MTTHAPDLTLTGRQAEPRLLSGPLLRLTLATAAYFTAAGMAIYTLPVYVTGPVGAGRTEAGVAFGAFAVTALLLRPVAGRLADTRGRRPLLVGGALLGALSLLLTGFVDHLALVILLRLLLGVAEAAFIVAAFATLADLAPAQRVGEATSYVSLGLYLGLAAGPPLGELVARGPGFTAAWAVAGGFSLLSAVVMARLAESRPVAPTPLVRPPLVHRPALAPVLGFLACTLAMSGFLAFVGLHAHQVGLGVTSLPLAMYGAVVVAGRLAFARSMDRLPPLALASAALAVMALALVLIAVWRSPAGLLVGTLLLGVGVTFSTPAFFAAVFARSTPAERGAASGTATAAIDLGLGAGPIGFGLVAHSAGLPWVFGLSAGVALAGAAWTLTLARPARGREDVHRPGQRGHLLLLPPERHPGR